ncbi:pineapple eye protein [Drosophila montana]|uniref:pineapple eye protein n=1 Tax=Drosophila montana TaxID=40370 RepID=UPI00313A7AE0
MYKCDICNKSSANEDTDDVLLYGEWMIKQKVTVHYYCLLLSTNLPQRGGDSSGILGFLLRDIRQEAAAAQQRKCAFCKEKGASVVCYKCRIVFHMPCGLENRCIYQFCDEFRSYCEHCMPLDDYQQQLMNNPPKDAYCDICFRAISPFLLHNVTYGDCCRKGFAHRTCMRRYALASGYYLRCLWCRDKKFHDTIRLQSVFVPDRDATWERQPNAYSELHSKRLRCEQTVCLCPNGRDYHRHSWTIQLCILCAATGTHLKCRVGTMRLVRTYGVEPNDFKCISCIEVEQKLIHGHHNYSGQRVPHKPSWETADEQIDASYYMPKTCCELSIAPDEDSPVLSDEDATSNEASVITVVPSQRLSTQSCPRFSQSFAKSPPAALLADQTVIELADSQISSTQQLRCSLKPPLLLNESFTCGGYFYLVVYEYNEHQMDLCTGTCTLRFAANDARLGDRSVEALQHLPLLETDVWFRDSNRGIYDKIDQYTKS